jgi:hypothetical protein
MTSATDALTIHQLLGRIVYFHALFIEPALVSGKNAEPTEPCCNHGTAPGCCTVDEVLAGTAWAVLDGVAATLPAQHRTCPAAGGGCCVTCRIAGAGATIAAGWAQAEQRAYGGVPPAEMLQQVCGRAAAVRMGRVFAAQHAARCPALDRLTADPVEEDLLPRPGELPLTGELLALWADPIATTRRPVASWLNHCTGLDDVRRVLDARRNAL